MYRDLWKSDFQGEAGEGDRGSRKAAGGDKGDGLEGCSSTRSKPGKALKPLLQPPPTQGSGAGSDVSGAIQTESRQLSVLLAHWSLFKGCSGGTSSPGSSGSLYLRAKQTGGGHRC